MDQYKSKQEIHQKHIDRTKLRNLISSTNIKKEDDNNTSNQDTDGDTEMIAIMPYYTLPIPFKPIQYFERPKIKRSPKISESTLVQCHRHQSRPKAQIFCNKKPLIRSQSGNVKNGTNTNTNTNTNSKLFNNSTIKVKHEIIEPPVKKRKISSLSHSQSLPDPNHHHIQIPKQSSIHMESK